MTEPKDKIQTDQIDEINLDPTDLKEAEEILESLKDKYKESADELLRQALICSSIRDRMNYLIMLISKHDSETDISGSK
jgi:hypothetical protein